MKFSGADLEFVKNCLGGGNGVLVSAHVHPDPDAIGSALAAAEMVRQLGGSPKVVLEDEVPVRCRFLPGAAEIISFPKEDVAERFATGVIVDAGSLSRIGEVERLLEKDAVLFNIDHHVSNVNFGKLNFVDTECAATAELLFLLCRELKIEFSPSLASNLFAGLLTDTGRFRYSNTTAQTFRIASELAAAGADVTQITNGLYYDLPASDIFSMGEIFSTLEMFGDGQISTLSIRLDNIVEDPDTVVDLALSIHGVRVAALISESREGKIRVSLRSRDTVNVARIAEGFGGGGHERAAGFRMRGTLRSVRDRIMPVLLNAVGAKQATDAVELV